MSSLRERPAITGNYKWFALALLMLVGLTNYIDRLSISILQVPIRSDLKLTDSELGAITGLSFSLVYTLAALPIARLADRFSPKMIIVASLVVWNGMTMLCGLATGFLSLATFRMGVAIGESGCMPATQALLAHYFAPHQRGRAIAIWQMVFPLGSLLGIAAGGLLSEALGWRSAFVVIGGLGLAVAPAVMFFLVDSGPAEHSAPTWLRNANIGSALREVLSSRSFRYLLAGGFFAAMPLNAALNWNALFYGRIFGLPMSQLTLYLALMSGVGGALGMFGGGFISDRLGRDDSRWYCWLPTLAMLIAPLLMVAQYLFTSDPRASVALGIVVSILLNCWMPPQAAVAQSLVTPSNRALAAACILVTGGIGAAAGPFVTGLLSDLLVAHVASDAAALRYALVAVSLTGFIAGVLFISASRHLPGDLQRSEASARAGVTKPSGHQPASA